MTEYGRLFEESSVIRYELQRLLPGKLTGNYTPADARRCVRLLVTNVDALADKWERLEQRMRETED